VASEDYVVMMRESLEKKVSILEQIQVKNTQQANIFGDPNATPDELEENMEQKGNLVDQLVRLDNGFEQLFKKVEKELTENRARYRDEIIEMKRLIARITDLSVAIQKQEQVNHNMAVEKFSSIRNQIQKVRKSQKAVNTYYKNMMKRTYFDAQFLDNKK